MSFAGFSSSSITVVAATSVGLNEAVSDKRITWPIGVDHGDCQHGGPTNILTSSPGGSTPTRPTSRRDVYALAAAAGVGAISAPTIHRIGRKNPSQNIQ